MTEFMTTIPPGHTAVLKVPPNTPQETMCYIVQNWKASTGKAPILVSGIEVSALIDNRRYATLKAR